MRDVGDMERSKENLRRYLIDKLDQGDWHGVMDAAADLRELEVELRCAREAEREEKVR